MEYVSMNKNYEKMLIDADQTTYFLPICCLVYNFNNINEIICVKSQSQIL